MQRLTTAQGALAARAALVLGAIAPFGCLVEIEPLLPAIGGAAGAPTTAGDALRAGGPALEAAGAAGLGGAGAVVCEPGQKYCRGTCQVPSASVGCGLGECEACPEVPGAQMGCSEDGACVVLGCRPLLADCDGDTQSGGLTQSNGCEYSFGERLHAGPLTAPLASIVIDGSRQDWLTQSAGAVELAEPCVGCARDFTTPPVASEFVKPPRSDLEAYFRTAWDAGSLYLLGEIFDDHRVLANQDLLSVNNECDSAAECEDGIVVFFDGLNDRAQNGGGYGNDNHRLFIGQSGAFFAPTEGQPAAADVSVHVETFGLCTRFEVALKWNYLVPQGAGGGVPVPQSEFGFDIAVNDWDLPPGGQEVPVRDSQMFWINPGSDYQNSTAGLAPLLLTGPSQDASAGP